MGLQTYWRKRNFGRTPEPRGKRAAKARFGYVIQKHAARRLHYDFRLELDGTLKSWAVPKGPSFNPKERRLAVHVEDHPLEYGSFEGVIPKPEYGAGTVIVWDRGTWIPEGDPREGYKRGRLRFRLDGEKLHGTWNLIRTSPVSGAGKENWMLIKSKDEYAGVVDVVEEQPNSVQSGRSLEDVAKGIKPKIWHSKAKRAAKSAKSSARAKVKLPETLQMPLATLVEHAPQGLEWLHEIKHDGYRVLCRIEDGKAKLFSRSGQDYTKRMAAITRAVEEISGLENGWLDGEIVVLQENGMSNFSALQLALSEKRDRELVYYLFDAPYLNGRDLRELPLIERKRQLEVLLQKAPKSIRYSDHVAGGGDKFFNRACDMGLEGVISKRADSNYRSGRGFDWVKTKCRLVQEFVIGGYTDPSGTREGFGALALGVYDRDGNLRYCGRTGTGFNADMLKLLYPRLKKLAQRESPFAGTIPREALKGAHWIRPELVAQIEFASWTRDGMVRQGAFQGLREDKPARDVRREVPKAKSAPAAEETDTDATPEAEPQTGAQKLVNANRITNADKVLFPDQGLTKGELAAYYATVRDWMLPYVAERPLTLKRCPDGRHKACFFQKHATKDMPSQLLRVPLKEENGKHQPYLAIDSAEGLLALVQMGVLEIHVWGARIDKPEFPDQLVLDLDPDAGLPWRAVTDAATLVRARLDDLGLPNFLRTTGGKGLHVVVPLARRQGWDEVKAFAKAVAEDIARQDPQRYTIRLPFAARKGKIFIDYLRNGRGATAITNYSTRAREGAPVAVPLAWSELSPKLRSDRFSVRNVFERLNSLKRDPWADFDDARSAITAVMMRSVGVKRN